MPKHNFNIIKHKRNLPITKRVKIMRLIYYKNGLYKIPRPGQATIGVCNGGNITRDIAVKYGIFKRHRKGHGARSNT